MYFLLYVLLDLLSQDIGDFDGYVAASQSIAQYHALKEVLDL
jgi:hypothetical protein